MKLYEGIHLNFDITDNPQFKRWFGNSKIKNRNGPIKVYHGTLSSFTQFDITKHRGGFVGPGFYFSSSITDINKNYATSKGPDISNHIDEIYNSFDNDDINLIVNNFIKNHPLDAKKYNKYTKYKLESKAFKDFINNHPEILKNSLGIEHQGSIMPCYLKMENPCIIGFGNKDTYFNNDNKINNDNSDLDIDYNPEGDAAIILDILSDYDSEQNTTHSHSDLYDYFIEYGGISASELHNFINLGWDYDDQSYMISFKDILVSLDYDGVIMNAKYFFGKQGISGHMKNTQNAIHYIVWKPNQIKSALGNKGNFDYNNSDIRESQERIFESFYRN
jgi:hypothetical protein